ncbi:MAG: MFS transporter, partial [Armatimonadota bacterium]|nr:MFS transporter [Armatimonadota bacterium]
MPYYRRNLYVLSLTMFLAAVSWNQVLPFLPLFLKEMGVKRHLMQWSGIVFAAQSLAAIVTLPYWGKLGDKYGQKQMTIRAGIFLTLIYLGMSICQTPFQLAALRFLNGALTGFMPGSITLIATNTPKEMAPRFVATAQTASAAGQILGPALGGFLAAIIGYRGSMQISGIAVLVSTILVLVLVQVKNKPEPSEKTSLLEDFAISFRSPVLLFTMIAVMLYSIYLAAIFPFLTLHLGKMSRHAPQWLTAAPYSLPPLAFMLSAHLWSRIGERRGYDRAIHIGMLTAGTCAVALIFVHNIWAFSLIFFIAGVFLAAISPSAGAIICTRVEEGFRGRAYGMLYSAGTLGALIAPLVAGQIAASMGVQMVFVFAGISLLMGSMWLR